MNVIVQRRASVTVKITEDDIVKFLYDSGVLKGKTSHTRIAVQIPGGGDYSGTLLEVHDLADGCITVTCDVEEGS